MGHQNPFRFAFRHRKHRHRAQNLVANLTSNHKLNTGIAVHPNIINLVKAGTGKLNGILQMVGLAVSGENKNPKRLFRATVFGKKQIFLLSVPVQIRNLNSLLVFSALRSGILATGHGALHN